MTLYDITIPLRPDTAVFPGDVPFTIERTQSITSGDAINLGSITLSLHAGTHIDAPYHISQDGSSAESLNLDLCIGNALLISIENTWSIGKEHLRIVERKRPTRLLLRTGAWQDFSIFPDEVPTLSEGAVEYLAACGVRLLGLDVPSVDKLTSKDLPNHKALLRYGITILESIDLRTVPDGEYELCVLPLKIEGADGAPARAILKGIPT